MKVTVVRESYDTPEELQAVLTRVGGLNPYGEPRFKLIWGWKWLGWIGGEWVDYDRHGNYIGTKVEMRLEPRTLPADRWCILKWVPPELYGPKSLWYATTTEVVGGVNIESLGPFPSRGDYELSWRVELNGEFLQVTRDILEEYVKRVLYCEQFGLSQRLRALKAREEKQEKEADARRRSIFRNRDLLYTNPDSGKKSYATQLDNSRIFKKEKSFVIAP